MPATETAKPTFQEAYKAAKEEVETKAAEEKTTETVEEGETETAKTQEAEETKAEGQPSETAEEEALLSKEDESKLRGESAAAYKSMQRAYTQKTQKLAEERKKVEQYRTLIDALESDPQEAVKRLAGAYGLQVAEPEKQRVESTVQTVTDESVQQLREALGPEGEVLADRLAPVFENLARRIAQTVVHTEVDPIRQAQEKATAEALASEAQSDLEAFGKRHEDWKQYEDKMVELGKRFQPTPGSVSDTSEYLETLYYLATRDQSEAATTKKVVDRLNKSAKAASQETAGVKQQIVAASPPKRPTFKEAWEAAKRGEKWE